MKKTNTKKATNLYDAIFKMFIEEMKEEMKEEEKRYLEGIRMQELNKNHPKPIESWNDPRARVYLPVLFYEVMKQKKPKSMEEYISKSCSLTGTKYSMKVVIDGITVSLALKRLLIGKKELAADFRLSSIKHIFDCKACKWEIQEHIENKYSFLDNGTMDYICQGVKDLIKKDAEVRNIIGEKQWLSLKAIKELSEEEYKIRIKEIQEETFERYLAQIYKNHVAQHKKEYEKRIPDWVVLGDIRKVKKYSNQKIK